MKTQVWTAISVYVLVAILRKRLDLDSSLYTILQILSVTALEKTPITEVLTPTGYTIPQGQCHNQLTLFDL